MGKQIKFTFEGIDYTLEYTKRTIKEMEGSGFRTSLIDDMPMTLLPRLFQGAFLAHHRFTKTDVIDRIYEFMPDKPKLVDALSEMYNEPISTLMDEPDENLGKNIEWTQNWEK